MTVDPGAINSLSEQLADARMELRQLEEMLAEYPSIVETRFRQQLHALQETSRLILRENHELLAQLERKSSPAWSTGALNWQGLVAAVLPLRSWGVIATVAGLVLVAGVPLLLAQSWWASRSRLAALPPVPTAARLQSPTGLHQLSVAGSSETLLDLQAVQPSWVEVQDRQGQLLLKDTLENGAERRIRLRNGLVVYVARPEQVRYRVDEGGWQPWPVAAGGEPLLIVPRPS